MKKVILILALLLAATPAFATVSITATQTGPGQVVLSYTSDEAVAIRGMALDITVAQGPAPAEAATITAVDPTKTGETTSAESKGFGIFPGTITIAENGTITDTGTPVSPASLHADTQAGIGTTGVTIEMASLYDMDDAATLAPANSGDLCTVTVSHNCYLTVALNSIRGGIVLNDGKYSQDPCDTTKLVTDLTAATNVLFTWEVFEHTISGTVTGTDGVTMTGLPGNPVTSGGTYSCTTVPDGWSGTVTPTKAGYVFTPAATTYTNVTADMTTENYTGTKLTYTISGSVGSTAGSGVTMGGFPTTVTTTAGGAYTATVDYGWTGTVTPTKAGLVFTPAFKTYSNIIANTPAQTYTATPITFTISGTVNGNLSGVVMAGVPGTAGTPNTPATNTSGVFTTTVRYGWSGTCTPVKTGYSFSPANYTYSNVTAAITGQNFTNSTVATYTISGSTGTVSGVRITGIPGTAYVSTTGGAYTATVNTGWTGTVVPLKGGYTFSTTNKTYSNVQANQTSQNYTATQSPVCASSNRGDVSGNTSGTPDNKITPLDVSYLITILNNYGGKTKTISSTSQYYKACGDVSGTTSGIPDNKITSLDVSYLITVLNNYGGKSKSITCPTSY